ncbi:Zinc finger, C3HC4 type (RING finger) [Musa troglodytarum]|uniref:Zinc finger, C3HC4 type (RING finger) n=1 Tax=Musa troglodytarum TaxID=320322 RepID=A0A9E7H2Y8_9LILI|nr:Zinc finger, C3HC4 type (RING finger) [Musa troglodytarum]
MELQDGDEVRHLAGCLLVFHVECLDAWLSSHTSCPICRAMAS